jgi:hypothetical protein
MGDETDKLLHVPPVALLCDLYGPCTLGMLPAANNEQSSIIDLIRK